MQFVPRQQEVPIGGVRVKFPFKPYPSQKAMMAKIIQALNHSNNALLESPTGSGKSLALLCSVLAWQTQQYDKLKGVGDGCACPCHVKKEPAIDTDPVPTPCLDGLKTESGSMSCQNETETAGTPVVPPTGPAGNGDQLCKKESGEDAVCGANSGGYLKGCNEDKDKGGMNPCDEDFRKPKKRYRTPGGAVSGCKRVKGVVYEEEETSVGPTSCEGRASEGGPVWKTEVHEVSVPLEPPVMDPGLPDGSQCPPTPSSLSSHPPCGFCQCRAKGMMWSIPKVYFGTRTHTQITQITHELGKTAYTSTPMCILGSREHACIHPEVSQAKGKNDECRKLLEVMSGDCSFYYRVAKKLGSQAQLVQYGLTTAWDMEDFVSLGKRVKACPYFAVRGIKEEAHIVFCPYNYLIDPLIREQMLIDLKDQVVVLDEAHNMEDSAREAASQTVTSAQLEEMSKELHDILDGYFGKLRQSFEFLAGICDSVKSWIASTISSLPHDGFDQACGIWSGPDYIPTLQGMGIIPLTPVQIKSSIKSIMDAVNEQKRDQEEECQEPDVPCPSMATVSVMKGLAMVLSNLFQDGDNYRISLMRTAVTKYTDDGWKRRRRSRVPEKAWLYSLHFWCLNPAVAFSDLSCAKSVILTSGTLSPLSSFSSELGMVFSVQLEANHVVPNSQTFICSVSCGPHGKVLCANYQNSETFDFQDEVGAVVHDVCQTVPSGVLCFFSSYKMLNKLVQRWQVTGMWTTIEQKKAIVIEPHGSNKAEFEAAIKQFYRVIEGTGDGHMTGALFLAVCRGKVSEGLDFSDGNARAVITVGIPFPSIKDKQVELKREYNNQYCRSRGLLTGSEWYEIQAFRAINQALGRCIRHRRDWGALILVDERFGKGIRYTRGLSKWIRQRLCHQRDFSAAMMALTAFSERMTADSSLPGTNPSASLSSTVNGSSVMEPSSHSFADGSTVQSPSPLPSPSPLYPATSTPTPHGKTRWLPPYCTTHTQQHGHPRPRSDLGSLISQLRAFQYPQPHPLPSATFGELSVVETAHGCVPLPNESIKQDTGCTLSLDESVEITKVETSESVADPILIDSSPNPSSPHSHITPVPPSHSTSATLSSTSSPLLFPTSDITITPRAGVTTPTAPPTAPMAGVGAAPNTPTPPKAVGHTPDNAPPPLLPTASLQQTVDHPLHNGVRDGVRVGNGVTPERLEEDADKTPPLLLHSNHLMESADGRGENQDSGPTSGLTMDRGPTSGHTSGHTSGPTMDRGHTSGHTSGPTMDRGHTSGPTSGPTMDRGHTSGPTMDRGHTSGPTSGPTMESGPTSGHTMDNGGAPVPKMLRTKANTRLTSRKSGRLVAGTSSGCGDNGRYLLRRSRNKSSADCPKMVSGTVTCAGCGLTISKTTVSVERLELKETSHCLGNSEVHQIQNSLLWSHLGVGQGEGGAYLMSGGGLMCREREEGGCNAVWDGKLGLCYGLVECTCGHMVGVKVHIVQHPQTMGWLTNKVLLSAEKTSISS